MDENTILTLAKATLLSKEEVQMWVDHLSCLAKPRQAGEKKAAKSRAKKGASFNSNLWNNYHDGKCYTAETSPTLSSEYCHCYTTNVNFMFLHFTAQQKPYCFCQNTDDGSQAMIGVKTLAASLSGFTFNVLAFKKKRTWLGSGSAHPLLFLPDAYRYPRCIISISWPVILFGFLLWKICQ